MNRSGDETRQDCNSTNEQCFPPNVEEGRDAPSVPSNPNDNLDFGWFSLPRESQEEQRSQSRPMSVSGRGTGSRPVSQSGRDGSQSNRPGNQADIAGSYSNRPGSQAGRGELPCIRPGRGNMSSRPVSQSGLGPQNQLGSNQRPPTRSGRTSQAGRPCSKGGRFPPMGQDAMSGQPMSAEAAYAQQQPSGVTNDETQRLVVGNDPELADFENQPQQGVSSGSYPGGVSYDQQQQQEDEGGCSYQGEIEYVDWPLSRAAQEMMMRTAPPPAEPSFPFEDKFMRPGSTAVCPASEQTRDIPPTPLPPINWGGYSGSSRPTYATWREQWHQAHGRPRSMQTGRHNRSNPFNIDYNNNSCHNDSNDSNIDEFDRTDTDHDSLNYLDGNNCAEDACKDSNYHPDDDEKENTSNTGASDGNTINNHVNDARHHCNYNADNADGNDHNNNRIANTKSHKELLHSRTICTGDIASPLLPQVEVEKEVHAPFPVISKKTKSLRRRRLGKRTTAVGPLPDAASEITLSLSDVVGDRKQQTMTRSASALLESGLAADAHSDTRKTLLGKVADGLLGMRDVFSRWRHHAFGLSSAKNSAYSAFTNDYRE